MFRRLSYILTITLFTVLTSLGQTKQSGTIKYKFNDIDSIVNSNSKTLGDNSFFIAHQVWQVGSYVSYKDKHYSNPFEILFYYKQNGKYFAKKVDNFGVSKIILCDIKDINKFLDYNFIKMTSEELTIKQDTTRINDSIIEIHSTTTDHQREDKIWINYKGKF